jgi:hypothetical protein
MPNTHDQLVTLIWLHIAHLRQNRVVGRSISEDTIGV